jgi:hypothetical protein
MSEDNQATADEAVEEERWLWEGLDEEHKRHIEGIQEIYQQLLRERRDEASAPCGNAVDEVLDDLHTYRLAVDAYFGHDLQKYLDHLRELHKELLRQGWVEAPPPPPEYVRRVRRALARVRRNPHLLDFGQEDGSLPAEDEQRRTEVGSAVEDARSDQA